MACLGRVELEVCVDTVEGLKAAQEIEVDRIELCGPLSVGGVTPSYGLMCAAGHSAVPALAMIRPRAGGFVYSPAEEVVMLADIDAARSAGMAGVVLGASRPDGTLNIGMLERLVARAHGLDLTLHRVFDLTPDPFEALEQAIRLGFTRILTSGHSVKAWDGRRELAQLVQTAAGRIQIMAGSGVSAQNVAALVEQTGLKSVHASCRGDHRPWDNVPQEFGFGEASCVVDRGIIAAMRKALAKG